jgi:CheY-like chemotaxis protein
MPFPEDKSNPQDPSASPFPLLIADDNVDAAESLALLLSLEGYDVHVAVDGVRALALAVSVRPRVAVLDIGMPGMDGHELARQLRRQPWATGMLIVALTGWGQPEDRRRALDAGFDRHFTKPVDPMELMDCIATWRSAHPRSV